MTTTYYTITGNVADVLRGKGEVKVHNCITNTVKMIKHGRNEGRMVNITNLRHMEFYGMGSKRFTRK